MLNRSRTMLKWLSVIAIAVAVAWLTRVLPVQRAIGALETAIGPLGAWRVLVFASVFTGGTVLLAPAWPFSVAAGVMFGLFWGTVLVSVSSTTAAAAMFLIARYLARRRVARLARRYRKLAAVDRAIGERGWKIVAMLRVSLVIPFSLQSYFYGLTSIRFWPCMLASWIAMLPGTLLYVYLGYLGRTGLAAAADEKTAMESGRWALRIVGFAATLAVTLYIARAARKAIGEETRIEPNDPPPEPPPGSSG